MAGDLGYLRRRGHRRGAWLFCCSSAAKPAVKLHPLNTTQTLPFPFLPCQGEAGDIGQPGAAGSQGEKVWSAFAQPSSGCRGSVDLFLCVQNLAEKEIFKSSCLAQAVSEKQQSMIPGVQESEGTGFAKTVILLFQGERGSPGDQGPMGPRVGVPSLTEFWPFRGSKDSGTTLTVRLGLAVTKSAHRWAVAVSLLCILTPTSEEKILLGHLRVAHS